MDIMHDPLHNDLPIPWEKIKMLDMLRYVDIQNPENHNNHPETLFHNPASGLDGFEVLKQMCENCIRSRQYECSKTGSGGACNYCARKRMKCSLTEAVQAHWNTIGRSRGKSRSLSIGPKMKRRAASIDSTAGQRQNSSGTTRYVGATKLSKPGAVIALTAEELLMKGTGWCNCPEKEF
jgi:hypothetical protein